MRANVGWTEDVLIYMKISRGQDGEDAVGERWCFCRHCVVEQLKSEAN